MKTKNKERQVGRSINNNEDERSPEKDESVRNDQVSRRQRASAVNDLERNLSRGFFPDGPGGNYKGV